MVHGVVGSGEVEGQKDILLGAGAVRGVPAARLREVPAVLDLLDEAADVVLHRPPLPEADLLCWDQSVPLHEVAQPGEDQPLDELAEVAREGDGPVAGDALFVLPGLRDGDDPGLPPLSWHRPLQPGHVDETK